MPETLSRYRQIATRRVPAWIFALLAFWWLGSLVSYYLEEPDTSDIGVSAFRLTEPSWAVASELEDDPLWLQYLLLFESADSAKKSCVEYFETLQEEDLLDARGEQSLRIMKSLTSDTAPALSHVALGRVKQDARNDTSWNWEVEALQSHFADAAPEWFATALEKEQQQQKTIFRLWVGTLALWLAAIIVGLPFIPAALACFKTANHHAPSPVTRCWHPIWMLGLVFLILNAGDWFYSFAYYLIPMPQSWQGSLFETLLFDGIWRFLGPALIAAYALVSWKHGGRILKLRTPPKLKPMLGMIPLVAAYDLIIWKLCDWTGLVDESNSSLYLEEDGINGLVYAIFSGVIFAPIAEEILFRGFLFQSLERRSSFWPATLISTLLFAMIHFYGFQGSLSVASFGIVACVLHRATDSLWTPIIYHAITNGIITASSWPLYNGLYSKW